MITTPTPEGVAGGVGLLGLLYALIRGLGVISRNRSIEAKGQLASFQAIFAAQESMLANCQRQIDSLRRELEDSEEKYRVALGEWTERFLKMEGQIKEYRQRVEYLESLFARAQIAVPPRRDTAG